MTTRPICQRSWDGPRSPWMVDGVAGPFSQAPGASSGVGVALVEFPHPLIAADFRFTGDSSVQIITQRAVLSTLRDGTFAPVREPRIHTMNFPQHSAQHGLRFFGV